MRDGLSLLDRAIAHAGSTENAAVTNETVRAMLGLADRTRLFDLLESVFKGDVKAALASLARQYEDGADMIMLLQDMLTLTHTLTRLQVAPASDLGPSFSDHERSRASDLASHLSVPELSRAWQMLLKGIDEVKRAPDALSATEMVLIRLTHTAQLPTPGELIRELENRSTNMPTLRQSAPSPAPVMTQARGQTAPALAFAPEPAPVAEARPAHLTLAASNPEPVLLGLADVANLLEQRREPMLFHHVMQSVEPIAFELGKIELHLLPSAPASLPTQLAGFLEQATKRKWQILSKPERGTISLHAERELEKAKALAEATQHPHVQAILEAFPGARMLGLKNIDNKA